MELTNRVFIQVLFLLVIMPVYSEECANEPSIQELQREAIQYAEVSPDKISDWRSRAARKAWLPNVSVGVDRNTTDLWHWEGGSTTKVDDDILRKGNDTIDWDVSLTWDLGDLIYNDDQTSIDSRSKLTVQLRNDILEELNSAYFERKRLNGQLNTITEKSSAAYAEKALKIEELTAKIDGLTGGYLSLKTDKR